MVDVHLRGRDITSARVLKAMEQTARHAFVPEGLRSEAYSDHPLPIGHRQTISQPYIVALMTQLSDARAGSKVLDVGTGSGYQAAVLAQLGAKVWTIEIVQGLCDKAKRSLHRGGYVQVSTQCGDGYGGWPEHAPFDAIVVAAAPDHVPQALIDQLAPGGKLVIPVGPLAEQLLLVVAKDKAGKVSRREVIPVRFVPMTGAAQSR